MSIAHLIVIPVYNHAGALRRVAQGALAHGPVLVVDDGSTDLAPARHPTGGPAPMPEDAFAPDSPLRGLPVFYARHERNRGKGKAILTGADIARQLGMTHIITIDADAQHDPGDIPLFVAAIAEKPMTLFVGKRDFSTADAPVSSRFGRSFSNFWYKVHTGERIGDSQCGFRAYPLALLDSLTLNESRYSFEIEVLVRSAWAGFTSADVPVRVYYQPKGERVSHFHPLMDNLRLTVLNTKFTARGCMPLPQKRFAQTEDGRLTPLRPMRSLRILLCRNETPKNLALAGALGVVIGALPIFGFHSLAIILVLGALGLSKITGLATSQLCMPPIVPALCIEAGHYLRHGGFLTEFSLQTLGYEAFQRLWEWFLGSLALAPALGLVCGVTVYILARIVRQGLKRLPEGAQ
ncbi:MAG: DUF2062 domain-containing protein [Desulfovibrio sp.]|jgi:uncharacterized protein (DUF2062 family)|nr:DUF2062 domain-containing protein [Desulfovibrio sp.]